jgi:hypothetical protein
MKKIVVILIVFCFQRINAQLCFGSHTNYATDTNPMGLVCADFNGDTIKDIITINYGAANISLLLGNGSGGFLPATNTVVCSWLSAICTADFNGDNKADIAVVCGGSDLVDVLLGNGSGGFSAPTSYSTTTGGPVSLATADFNGDGKVDLLASNMNSQNVSVLLGNGLGGFSAPTQFSVGSQPRHTIATDVNNDGKADIITANGASNNVSVLLGDGTGNFAAADSFAVGTTPYSVFAADLNGDGNIDLATANNASHNASVLLGDGTGHFGTATNFAVGLNPWDISAGDFDHDGKLDLVTANAGLNNVSILTGTGTGSFASAANFPAGTNPSALFVADMDQNGGLDIVVSNFTSNNVTAIMSCVPTSTCNVSVAYTLYQDTIPGVWDIIPQYSAQVDSAVWDWGDGTITSGLYPSHIYTTPNFYNKCVTVYNNCGDSTTTCHNDSVYRLSGNQIYVNVLPANTAIKTITDNQIRVYPNPAINEFSIEGGIRGQADLFDLNGICVLSKRISNNEIIDVSQLNGGMYTLRIRSAERVIYKRLLISR